MKKLIAVILVLALFLPAVAMADPDLASMTDQELKDLIKAASAELRSRATEEQSGTLLFECEGVKLYQTGDAYVNYDCLYVPVSIYSELDCKVSVTPEGAKVNDWQIYAGGISVDSKAKKKGELTFKIDDAEVKEIDQIDSLRLSWEVFNMDTWEWIHQGEEEECRFW